MTRDINELNLSDKKEFELAVVLDKLFELRQNYNFYKKEQFRVDDEIEKLCNDNNIAILSWNSSLELHNSIYLKCQDMYVRPIIAEILKRNLSDDILSANLYKESKGISERFKDLAIDIKKC